MSASVSISIKLPRDFFSRSSIAVMVSEGSPRLWAFFKPSSSATILPEVCRLSLRMRSVSSVCLVRVASSWLSGLPADLIRWIAVLKVPISWLMRVLIAATASGVSASLSAYSWARVSACCRASGEIFFRSGRRRASDSSNCFSEMVLQAVAMSARSFTLAASFSAPSSRSTYCSMSSSNSSSIRASNSSYR